MCGIASQLSPLPDSSGTLSMRADGFEVHSFQTLTGTTFMAVAEPNTIEAAELLKTTWVGPIFRIFSSAL
jgi:hypothetical protein